MSQKNQDIILQKLEKLSLLDDVVAKLDKLETTVGNLSSAVESLAGKCKAQVDLAAYSFMTFQISGDY